MFHPSCGRRSVSPSGRTAMRLLHACRRGQEVLSLDLCRHGRTQGSWIMASSSQVTPRVTDPATRLVLLHTRWSWTTAAQVLVQVTRHKR